MPDIKDLFKNSKSINDLNDEEKKEFAEKLTKIMQPATSSFSLPEQTLDALRAAASPFSDVITEKARKEFREMVKPLLGEMKKTSERFSSRFSGYNVNAVKPEFFTKEIKPINFAELKINSIAAETEERGKNLPDGKVLRVYVAFGGTDILASTFTPKDNFTIEVTGFDGNFNLVWLIVDCRQLMLMFREEIAPESDSDMVH
jgi:hypothetical protein